MKRENSFLVFLLIVISLIVNLTTSDVKAFSVGLQKQSSILYVKPGADGTCSSWTEACELQTALLEAASGDQIWVAEGTYKPTSTTDRTVSFTMKPAVGLYGGFPPDGGGWESRNWRLYLSTLSGEIGTINDQDDNSYHVVSGIAVDSQTVLDGFVIRDGNANLTEGSWQFGGGVYIEGSPTLRNMIVQSNFAITGGGLFLAAGSLMDLTDIDFIENSASLNGGGLAIYPETTGTLKRALFLNNSAENGGGFYSGISDSTLVDVTFSGNIGLAKGGGMYITGSSPSFAGVTFSSNTAGEGGGLFSTQSSNPVLTNVTFSGNMAIDGKGGGIYNSNISTVELNNVTLFQNTAASSGGGIYIFFSSSATITNSILWANLPDQIAHGLDSFAIVQYSDVEGGFVGDSNINENPLLDALAFNGGFTPTHSLPAHSPAVDSGSPYYCPATDQRGFPRPFDGDGFGEAICDMGAYEYNPLKFIYLPILFK